MIPGQDSKKETKVSITKYGYRQHLKLSHAQKQLDRSSTTKLRRMDRFS